MPWTLRSANICMMSAARARSPPATKPQRLRTLRASFGLKPRFSNASRDLSMAWGSTGALAGAMRPTVSPGFKRCGKVSINFVRRGLHAGMLVVNGEAEVSRCVRPEKPGIERLFDHAVVLHMNMIGAGIATRRDDVSDFIADEVNRRTVVESVAGRESACLDELVKTRAAFGFAVVVGRTTSRQKTEAGHRGERPPRIGQRTFKPTNRAGADAAENRAVFPGFAQKQVHAADAPDREQVARIAAADVHDVAFRDEHR